MSKLHMQVALNQPPQAVYRALTDTSAVAGWFAEHAEIVLEQKRYDFWGRYTPDTPDREAGRHPLLQHEAQKRLQFAWSVQGAETQVTFLLHQRDAESMFVVQHEGLNRDLSSGSFAIEDFWFLSLENLRRHLDHKPPVRCDFSGPITGDIRHEVEIDGPASAVFDALIRPEQLQRWIANRAAVEPEIGGRFDLGWGVPTVSKIVDIVPNQKLAISWHEETETVVTWTLAESGGKTRLTIVHSGFAPTKKTGGLQAGWLNFTSWVRSIVEYGPSWQPAILKLAPGTEAFYPASIQAAQSSIIES